MVQTKAWITIATAYRGYSMAIAIAGKQSNEKNRGSQAPGPSRCSRSPGFGCGRNKTLDRNGVERQNIVEEVAFE